MLDNLQLGEFIYEQPAVGDVEYTFKHALTHDVAYNSVLIERRKAMHERIGAALETLFADSLDDHAISSPITTAAAPTFARQSSICSVPDCRHSDARRIGKSLDQLSAALEFPGRLPDEPDATIARLPAACTCLCDSSCKRNRSRGARSCVLANNGVVGKDRKRPPVGGGVGGVSNCLHLARAEYDVALRLAHRLLEMAQAAGDPSVNLVGPVCRRANATVILGSSTRSAVRCWSRPASAQHEEDRPRLSSIDRRVISRLLALASCWFCLAIRIRD